MKANLQGVTEGIRDMPLFSGSCTDHFFADKNPNIRSVRVNHLLWLVSCHGCDLKSVSAGQIKTCYFLVLSKSQIKILFKLHLSIGITVQRSCWLHNEFKMPIKDFAGNEYYLKLDMWAGKSLKMFDLHFAYFFLLPPPVHPEESCPQAPHSLLSPPLCPVVVERSFLDCRAQ